MAEIGHVEAIRYSGDEWRVVRRTGDTLYHGIIRHDLTEFEARAIAAVMNAEHEDQPKQEEATMPSRE